MNHDRTYRPFSTCPHTYGVRPRPCTAIATMPCRPTACFREWQCFPTWAGGSPTIVHCTFYIVHCSTFTFSAKEKDSETGLSYFGSRYYSSDLSVWLSVDPMAHKYPSLSPYVYCANNPVKLVDPNGEEIGEYRDWNGNYLGTDGHNDFEVYFVSDEQSIDIIKKNNALKNGTTNKSDVKIDWETDKIAIHTMVLVYCWTVNNGGNREEAVTFPKKYSFPKFYPTGDDNGEIEIDSKGYLSIHSHKLNYFECPDGTGTCVQTPYDLSDFG